MRGATRARVLQPHDPRDRVAPVPALRGILRVPERQHEFVADFGVFREPEALALDAIRESVVR